MTAIFSEGSAASALNAYDEVLYVGNPFPNTHPDRLATIAKLHGIDATSVRSCRVLEIGCGDGANILPMAATLPDAQFVGCDLAARPIARAQQMAAGLGLRNVRIMHLDFRDMPAEIGSFDYIIVHGLYSWIPLEVRRRLLPVIARHLAPNGVALVSYNVYPGCRLRQASWDLLRFHTRDLPDLKSKLAAARSLITSMANAGGPNREDDPLRDEIRDMADRPDGGLCHDDLSETNDPVYFHEFVADAAGSGLAFLAESSLNTMAAGGYAPDMHNALARMDRLTREQYLDFLCFRRFRSSLLCHADALAGSELLPDSVNGMHVSPALKTRNPEARDATPLPDQDEVRAILKILFARWPCTVPAAEIAASFPTAATPVNFLLLELYIRNIVDLRTHPVAATAVAGERPSIFAPARLICRDCDIVPNLFHEGIYLGDTIARQLVAMLDGTRTRAELMSALGEVCAGPTGGEQLERALGMLAQKAMLVA